MCYVMCLAVNFPSCFVLPRPCLRDLIHAHLVLFVLRTKFGREGGGREASILALFESTRNMPFSALILSSLTGTSVWTIDSAVYGQVPNNVDNFLNYVTVIVGERGSRTSVTGGGVG